MQASDRKELAEIQNITPGSTINIYLGAPTLKKEV